MSTLAVVQARVGSTRLPGKVLMPVAGRPMLAFMLARLVALHVDEMVVATSIEERDDAIAHIAEAAGVPIVRGSESDVLARFDAALSEHPADIVVRLTADCPLVDPAIVNEAISTLSLTGADYASNTLVRTYPDGLDVEVVRATALRIAAAEATDRVEREHVTPFVYRRPERFQLASVVGSGLLGHERWTVDTADDLARIRGIVSTVADPITAGWGEFLSAARRCGPPTLFGLVLRPARAEDDAVFAPPVTFSASLGTPAVRSWVAETEQQSIGWAQVSVRSGVGQLSRWIATEYDEALIALVRLALSADYQVRELNSSHATIVRGSGHG